MAMLLVRHKLSNEGLFILRSGKSYSRGSLWRTTGELLAIEARHAYGAVHRQSQSHRDKIFYLPQIHRLTSLPTRHPEQPGSKLAHRRQSRPNVYRRANFRQSSEFTALYRSHHRQGKSRVQQKPLQPRARRRVPRAPLRIPRSL